MKAVFTATFQVSDTSTIKKKKSWRSVYIFLYSLWRWKQIYYSGQEFTVRSRYKLSTLRTNRCWNTIFRVPALGGVKFVILKHFLVSGTISDGPRVAKSPSVSFFYPSADCRRSAAALCTKEWAIICDLRRKRMKLILWVHCQLWIHLHQLTRGL